MLKIKDNIDLNILIEKYNFYFSTYYNSYIKDAGYNCEVCISKSRLIQLKIDADYEKIVDIDLPNIIYELFTDNLVENILN